MCSVVYMDQTPNRSRKMLDHTIPARTESDAEYFVTVCCGDRCKSTLALPHVAKIIFDAVQAYERRKLWFARFMLLMPDHLHGIFDFPWDASMQALANCLPVRGEFAGGPGRTALSNS